MPAHADAQTVQKNVRWALSDTLEIKANQLVTYFKRNAVVMWDDN